MPGPVLAGLDFTSTGLADAHRAWGVATAYVPRSAIVSAVRLGLATVDPSVDWLPGSAGTRSAPATSHGASGTGRGASGLDAPASVAVAVAATWPSTVRPVSVDLIDLGAAPSISGGSGRGRPAATVPLVNPLAAIVRMTPAGLDGVIALARVPWQLQPGTFFLPAADLPVAPAGWLTSAWRAGAYEFRVTLRTGHVIRLPFAIGN